MRTFLLFLPLFLFIACQPPDQPQAAGGDQSAITIAEAGNFLGIAGADTVLSVDVGGQTYLINARFAPAINENGQALAAGEAPAMPPMYVSYVLFTQHGGKFTAGVARVRTNAWSSVPVGQVYDPDLLLKDLIRVLNAEGVLRNVDLTKIDRNWILILFPGASPPAQLNGDSRKMKK